MDVQRDSFFILFGKSENENSWKGLWLLLGVYFGAILFSALISPWVYHGIIWWANNYPTELGDYLKGKRFDNYFDRLRWVPVLICLPLLMKECQLFSWQKLGIHLRDRGYQFFWRWAVVGMMLVGFAALLQAVFGTLEPTRAMQEGRVLRTLIFVIPGSLLVALLEEIVFRGLIFRIFYTALRPIPAIIIGSLFFAYTHFKMPSEVWRETSQVVDWSSGFFVGFWTIFGLVKEFEAIPFITYFVLGITLCLLFIRTRSLMPAIGLHAGLVYIMLAYKGLYRMPSDERGMLWGSPRLVDGIVPLLLLVVLAILLWVSIRERDKREAARKTMA